MREIKFRAISTHSGQFVYGNFIHSKRFKGCGNEFRIHESESGIESDVIPETVGQFTGLQDNNGVDIYEHDKVKVDSSGVGGAFHDGIYTVQYSLIDCAFYLDGTSGIGFNECYIYEVVGNIHETQTA